MRRTFPLLVAFVAFATIACGDSIDTVTSIAVATDPAPVPITFTTSAIQMPVGLAVHLHITGTDAKGVYGGGFVIGGAPLITGYPVVKQDGNDDWIVFALTPGSGQATIAPEKDGDQGTFTIPVTITP